MFTKWVAFKKLKLRGTNFLFVGILIMGSWKKIGCLIFIMQKGVSFGKKNEDESIVR